MEIITGIERRRRWSAEEKLRIVAETERADGGIAEIARRYEISRGLLWNWRSQVRRGTLRAKPPAVFVPVKLLGEAPPTEAVQRAVPPRSSDSEPGPVDGKVEITLPDGTFISVGHEVSLATLRRVVTALRR